jgi:uncharacterized protein (DUF1015 family)
VILLEPYFNAEPDARGTTDNDGVEHRLWVVDDAKVIDALRSFFQSRDVFIADGHHRYTTALNYHEQHPESDAAHACLFVLVAVEDPGMIVLPTHRVICGLEGFSLDRLMDAVGPRDDLTIAPASHTPDRFEALADALPEAGDHAMGLYDPARDRAHVMTFAPDPLRHDLPDRAQVWRQLDVAVLQELFIQRIVRPMFGGERIGRQYTADLDEMRSIARADRFARLGVIMQPTPLEAVCQVALADEVMPPKSTFFYPKLATGLVINPLF